MSDWFDQLTREDPEPAVWEPDFEPGRCLVRVRVGPWERLYLRPPGFRPRFYHRLQPLPVCRWSTAFEHALYDGLCRLGVRLTLHYQVTLEYVRRHPEFLAAPDAHVPEQLMTLVTDVVEREVFALEAQEWLGEAPGKAAGAIAAAVNETLTRHHLQCRALCRLQLRFTEDVPAQTGMLYERVCQILHQRRLAAQRQHDARRQALEEARLEHERNVWQLRREAEQARTAAETEDSRRAWEAELALRAERQRREAELEQERLARQARLREAAEARREAEVAAMRDPETAQAEDRPDPLGGLSGREKDQLLWSLEAYLGRHQGPLYGGDLVVRDGPAAIRLWPRNLARWLTRWRDRFGHWLG
ncbi:hypothetical protein MIN45_P0615 [Methylomarinovum tepidoasis]|uniref:Uncharacterized protein n=1 Tax=Methylomarinovum tepidoasis TaxID=2840183 RepID=A0AAU9CBY2_9GAMM|nr:hypothetical protein [Methylomarinovum sp. IN45]BCX88246.1 hypothetical protein MIN45_P0615 [Methylomarinovum sp. IN45]